MTLVCNRCDAPLPPFGWHGDYLRTTFGRRATCGCDEPLDPTPAHELEPLVLRDNLDAVFPAVFATLMATR